MKRVRNTRCTWRWFCWAVMRVGAFGAWWRDLGESVSDCTRGRVRLSVGQEPHESGPGLMGGPDSTPPKSLFPPSVKSFLFYHSCFQLLSSRGGKAGSPPRFGPPRQSPPKNGTGRGGPKKLRGFKILARPALWRVGGPRAD
ncbi:hypothetical protein PIB30_036572 [Stylosanthes scabra]|uniref:Secreted protein n=1 Tax=Stylosanthes scabra TaxID=79078 RepID=A0ABU6XEA9_9FABA|nr:hypothetical protein [Stylosanthes scabra]